MQVSFKLDRVRQEIQNISTHIDEDAAVLLAALDKIHEMLDEEKAKIQNRIKQAIEKLTNKE
jgi:cell division protein ZapA (FtsZ GTPase activity inhibitor)